MCADDEGMTATTSPARHLDLVNETGLVLDGRRRVGMIVTDERERIYAWGFVSFDRRTGVEVSRYLGWFPSVDDALVGIAKATEVRVAW
jgi:hypothetical protein